MKRKLVCGVGVNDADYVVRPGGRWCPFYRVWFNTINRCYSDAYQVRRPTYKGCKVCPEWKYFMTFRAWMIEQEWANATLDKDILGDGKLYSPSTCCFVPSWLNSMFADSRASRGGFPIGVSRFRNKYQAKLSQEGRTVYLGVFETPDLAYLAYLKARREYAENKLTNYKDCKVKRAVLLKISDSIFSPNNSS